MSTFTRFPLILGLLLAGLCLPVQAEDLQPVERQLLKAARDVLNYAKEHNVKNIGVLKFRIKQGDRPASDRVGPLNLNLADRLELALILRNSIKSPVGIVHDASAVASTIEGASHLSAAGREKLFTGEYPLAWGKAKVTPDLFITGAVEIPADLSRMTVVLMGFEKGGELTEVTRFDAKPGVTDIIESGASFTRGVMSQPGLKNAPATAVAEISAPAAVPEAAAVNLGLAKHPLEDVKSPLIWEILYDRQVQKIEISESQARVMEPNEKQQVTFVIRRRDSKDKRRYAVVLKVNGENTIDKERLPDLDCRKRILEADQTSMTISGYLMQNTMLQTFRVLSKPASKARTVDYGEDVGTFSLVVYTERDVNKPAPAPAAVVDLLDEDGEDFVVLQRNRFPADPPENLSALRFALVQKTAAPRGLVIGGDTTKTESRVVTFEADPIPLLSAVVQYYKP